MPYETERKFLVKGDFKTMATEKYRIVQGYISTAPDRIVRIRIKEDRAFLTIKGSQGSEGLRRYEWETEIPFNDGLELINLCEFSLIEKIRYDVPFGNHIYEVDEFLGENSGLIVAEIELKQEEEAFEKPPWIGREVTGEEKYNNAVLIKNPFSKWKYE